MEGVLCRLNALSASEEARYGGQAGPVHLAVTPCHLTVPASTLKGTATAQEGRSAPSWSPSSCQPAALVALAVG